MISVNELFLVVPTVVIIFFSLLLLLLYLSLHGKWDYSKYLLTVLESAILTKIYVTKQKLVITAIIIKLFTIFWFTQKIIT